MVSTVVVESVVEKVVKVQRLSLFGEETKRFNTEENLLRLSCKLAHSATGCNEASFAFIGLKVFLKAKVL